MKRIILTIVVLVVAAGLCFAGAQAEEAATGAEEAGSGIGDLPKLTFTNDTVVVLGWNDRDLENSNAIIPELYPGINTIEIVVASWGDYATKLAAMVAADDSPDVARFRPPDFPALWYQDIYQPIDDIIQADNPYWDDVRDQMDTMRYKGKIMVAPVGKTADVLWSYNKRILEENGLEDPLDLRARGEWTWDAFKSMAVAVTQDTDGDGEIDQRALGGGFARVLDSLIAATGAEAFTLAENGMIEANHKSDPRILRAYQYFDELFAAGVMQPVGLSGKDAEAEFGNGNLVFLAGGPWRARQGNMKPMVEAGEMGMITAPRAEGVDEDYYSANPFMYMIPTGAKNPQGGLSYAIYRRESQFFGYGVLEQGPVYDVFAKVRGERSADVVADWSTEMSKREVLAKTGLFEKLGNGVHGTGAIHNPIINGEMTPIQAIEAYVPQFEANMQDLWAEFQGQ